MFRVTVLLASLLAVAAFSPRFSASRGNVRALSMKFENEVGALPPTGFWDPLGMICHAIVFLICPIPSSLQENHSLCHGYSYVLYSRLFFAELFRLYALVVLNIMLCTLKCSMSWIMK